MFLFIHSSLTCTKRVLISQQLKILVQMKWRSDDFGFFPFILIWGSMLLFSLSPCLLHELFFHLLYSALHTFYFIQHFPIAVMNYKDHQTRLAAGLKLNFKHWLWSRTWQNWAVNFPVWTAEVWSWGCVVSVLPLLLLPISLRALAVYSLGKRKTYLYRGWEKTLSILAVAWQTICALVSRCWNSFACICALTGALEDFFSWNFYMEISFI